jgi:hypothetical protein
MFNKNGTAIPRAVNAVMQGRGGEGREGEGAKIGTVILLGDGTGDVFMADGIPHDNLLKVGFLNHDEDKLLAQYSEIYDVVITGDGSFGYMNGILRQLQVARRRQRGTRLLGLGLLVGAVVGAGALAWMRR